MRLWLRMWASKLFTVLAGGSVLLMALSLLVILGPMLLRGSSAVGFSGTVEFRRMQMDLFNRGDYRQLQQELEQTAAARRQVFGMLDRFRVAVDPDVAKGQVQTAYQELRAQLREQPMDAAQRGSAFDELRDIRQEMDRAFDCTEPAAATAMLNKLIAQADEPRWSSPAGKAFFEPVRQYRKIVQTLDLPRRQEYAAAFADVEKYVTQMLGPRPGQQVPDMAQFRYGSTRWDQAQAALDKLLWVECWQKGSTGSSLVKVRTPREKLFEGTELAGLFPLMSKNLSEMLLPRGTFYWQYFIDDSTPGHYFGGVGPEIIGTAVLAILAMLIALPLGVVSAAYLVECAGDNAPVRLLRTCINSLAGVPSIVFGLFGLAFFVLVLLPHFGMGNHSSIWAGGLTLAMMVLPLMIRASEEAIKAVPRTYKEAALAVGASPLRAFVTVTLPAALPGILTGVILSVSRAAGETAPILFCAAIAVGQPIHLGNFPHFLTQPTRTLSYGSYDMAVGDRISSLAPHNQYGMIMTLVLLILLLNLLAIVLRTRMARRLRGQ